MALFKRGNPDDYVKNYEMHPEQRFNFHNKEFKISPGKTQTYMDKIITQSTKIPSPDKYTGAR